MAGDVDFSLRADRNSAAPCYYVARSRLALADLGASDKGLCYLSTTLSSMRQEPICQVNNNGWEVFFVGDCPQCVQQLRMLVSRNV